MGGFKFIERTKELRRIFVVTFCTKKLSECLKTIEDCAKDLDEETSFDAEQVIVDTDVYGEMVSTNYRSSILEDAAAKHGAIFLDGRGLNWADRWNLVFRETECRSQDVYCGYDAGTYPSTKEWIKITLDIFLKDNRSGVISWRRQDDEDLGEGFEVNGHVVYRFPKHDLRQSLSIFGRLWVLDPERFHGNSIGPALADRTFRGWILDEVLDEES